MIFFYIFLCVRVRFSIWELWIKSEWEKQNNEQKKRWCPLMLKLAQAKQTGCFLLYGIHVIVWKCSYKVEFYCCHCIYTIIIIIIFIHFIHIILRKEREPRERDQQKHPHTILLNMSAYHSWMLNQLCIETFMVWLAHLASEIKNFLFAFWSIRKILHTPSDGLCTHEHKLIVHQFSNHSIH